MNIQEMITVKLRVQSMGYMERVWDLRWENYPYYPNDISKNKEP